MSGNLIGATFALGTAVSFACFSIVARKGQRYANAISGVLMGLIVNIPLLLIPVAYLWEPGWWNLKALLLFAGAGLMGPASGRVFLVLSIHYLGVARAMPMTSTSPLFTAVIAYLILGERPGPFIWLGTILIAAGSAALSYKKGSDASWDRRHLWLPLLCVSAISFSFVFRKLALTIAPSPVLGAFVASLAGLIFLVTFLAFLPASHRPDLRWGKGWYFYGAGGVFNMLGFLSQFAAINAGDVSIVVPLSATAPFFSLLLSAFLLRGVERVTVGILAGTFLIVAGAALIGWRIG